MRAIRSRLDALEATRPAAATDRAATLARVLAKATAAAAGLPYEASTATNPATLAHRARLLKAIEGGGHESD